MLFKLKPKVNVNRIWNIALGIFTFFLIFGSGVGVYRKYLCEFEGKVLVDKASYRKLQDENEKLNKKILAYKESTNNKDILIQRLNEDKKNDILAQIEAEENKLEVCRTAHNNILEKKKIYEKDIVVLKRKCAEDNKNDISDSDNCDLAREFDIEIKACGNKERDIKEKIGDIKAKIEILKSLLG